MIVCLRNISYHAIRQEYSGSNHVVSRCRNRTRRRKMAQRRSSPSCRLLLRFVLIPAIIVACLSVTPAQAQQPAAPGEKRATYSVNDADWRTAVRGLCGSAGVRCRFDASTLGVEGRITLSLNQVTLKTALDAVLRSLGGKVFYGEEDGVYVFRSARAQAERPQRRVSLSLSNADLRAALKTLFNRAQLNYKIAPKAQGRVTLAVNNQPFQEVLDIMLRTAKANPPVTYLKEQGTYLILPMNDPRVLAYVPKQRVTLQVNGMDLRYAIKALFNQVRGSYAILNVRGTVTVNIQNEPFLKALQRLLRAGKVPVEWRIENGVFIVLPAPSRK
jgi:type II secretory pathway component GspD/PulD (secretin)